MAMSRLRVIEREEKYRGAWKQQILMSDRGRAICSKLRREHWYQLMSQAPDRTLRRLAASILMATALDEVRPKRFN